MSKKPKLLIIGHARHGKDTVADLISDAMGLDFTSSSEFVARKAIWPWWGESRYDTFEDFFEDRVNHRKLWGDLIEAYCTPDKTKITQEMWDEGLDLYVGQRRRTEFDACMDAGLYNLVIWVDASQRLPSEPFESNELTKADANITIDNNYDGEDWLDKLKLSVRTIHELLIKKGFDVLPLDKEEEKESQLTWEDAPEGSAQVLDHGFIVVRDVMGSDSAIAESARMSYGRGTKSVNTDAGLIKYLVRNHHTSPLEMGEIRFHMRLPIFVMRQLVRHRTANLNEYSGRYSEMVRLFYVPEHAQIMSQSKGPNKQMSGEPLPVDDAQQAIQRIINISNDAFDSYEKLLNIGVSRETARIVLPSNTYTEVVWKLDVSNLLKFLTLRDDDHAQWEIREYAKRIAEAVQHFFPLTYAAYEEVRQSTTLTQPMIKSLILGRIDPSLSKSETAQLHELMKQHTN